MCENRQFSEMRRECVNGPKMCELHAKCVQILGRSAFHVWEQMFFSPMTRKLLAFFTPFKLDDRINHSKCEL